MMTDDPVRDAEIKALADEEITNKVTSRCPVCGKCGRAITGAGIVLKDGIGDTAVCWDCVLNELLKIDDYVSDVINEVISCSDDFVYDAYSDVFERMKQNGEI